MKPRFFLIILILALLIIVGLAYAATRGGNPQKSPEGGLCQVTLTSQMGLQYIRVTNKSTGSSWIVMPSQLPYTFNCAVSETLSFNATAQPDYQFNIWLPKSNVPSSNNPVTVTVTEDYSLEAQFTPTGT